MKFVLSPLVVLVKKKNIILTSSKNVLAFTAPVLSNKILSLILSHSFRQDHRSSRWMNEGNIKEQKKNNRNKIKNQYATRKEKRIIDIDTMVTRYLTHWTQGSSSPSSPITTYASYRITIKIQDGWSQQPVSTNGFPVTTIGTTLILYILIHAYIFVYPVLSENLILNSDDETKPIRHQQSPVSYSLHFGVPAWPHWCRRRRRNRFCCCCGFFSRNKHQGKKN